MLQARKLTKRYGATLALDRLDLTVPDGAIFGLLGPNGSGKSTFLRLLMALIFPDAGTISRGGIRRWQIGYLPERPSLPPRSRVDEIMRLAGRLAGVPTMALEAAVASRLEQVGLSDVAQTQVGSCSKGMLQRLGLAVALVGDPSLIVLDEPLEGLDPTWQKAARDLIRQLQREGRTILLSTHRLTDVADLCTEVAILNRGRLRQVGPLAEVLPLQSQITLEVDHLPEAMASALVAGYPDVTVEGKTITLAGDAVALKPAVLRTLLDAGIEVQSLRQRRASLEEVYLEAVKS